MADPRRVFIVCNNFEELGGLQRWVHHIGALFAERGHQVHLVGITHADQPHGYGDNLPYDTTVLYDRRPPAPRWRPRWPWDHLNLPAQARRLRRRTGMRRAAAGLAELFRTAPPGAVVIAAQVWAMEWVALALHQAGSPQMPVIGMSHESYQATSSSTRYERVRRYFADVDRLLLLTLEDADMWALDGMSNVDVMPNPIHVTPTRYPTLSEPVVVRLGRLSFEKGQDMLLEAWAKVAPTHPGWRLRLYGSGPQQDTVHRLVADLGLSDSVGFPGPTADLQDALTGASIYALTSREEGFPLAILEAMAYGLPTVAFDCAPGVRALLTHDVDGIVVTPGNTTEFAKALDRLMDNPDLRRRLGAAARTSVHRFHPDAILDRWEQLFALLHR